MLGKRIGERRPMSVLDALRPPVGKGAVYHVMAHCGAAQFDCGGFTGMHAEK